MSLVGEFGGTGATFIVPLLLILFMKSKQLKAVGKASIVPVAFAVNEPLLFGAPMILNPYMLIPFVAAGCVNVSVAKFFIDNVGMNGFSFVVPWATPPPSVSSSPRTSSLSPWCLSQSSSCWTPSSTCRS